MIARAEPKNNRRCTSSAGDRQSRTSQVYAVTSVLPAVQPTLPEPQLPPLCAPAALPWRSLSETEAALLDFLRNRGESSELSPEETVGKLLGYFREPGRFERLCKVAQSEPPRVRAILGAIGQELGQPASGLAKLQAGLNPLSRFDFGSLAVLEHSREWQAKERRSREAV